jgi:pro-kumamolisin-like protein/Big-like domain-containing protein
MKVHKLNLARSAFFGAFLLALSCWHATAQTPTAQSAAVQTANVPARITGAVDETNRVKLRGNVHPLARAEFDRGIAPAELPMQRMLLVLTRSTEQQSALGQLMADQYNVGAPSFHQWLTPEQFGQQFGPADADIQTVTSWLQTHGFQVAKVSKGKIAIEFSGTAAQVQEAFRTEIHKYVVNGEQHWANASDPQIPSALAPVVHGIASLHNFRPKPMHHVAGAFTKARDTGEVQSVRPEFTTPGGNFALGPTDFAKIYNALPLWNAGTPIDGTGQSIAIIGVSNINLQDVLDFRTVFGLPTGGANTPIVVIDGSDPGIVNDGSETEALADVEWSGGVAKGAQIHFVIAANTDSSPGLFLAAFHVIDTNSDPIMSLSFGNCEQSLGTGGNQALNSLWEQAAAQGITVTISTGDTGAAGCEDQTAAAPNPATTGLQVSGYASTPFNVAVGGTDFNDNGTQSTYFKPNAQNDPTTLLSAISYIPESTWNDSCTNAFFGATNAETNCNASATANKAAVFTVGGSGGGSHCTVVTGGVCSGGYTKPAFQSFISLAQGMPADGHRDIPDVSLFASDGFNKSFYVVCEADDKNITANSCKKGTTFQFLAIGGTSLSTPSFAGILALVNQKTGQRQGNANFVLYKLAQQQFTAATACTSQASPLPAAGCTFNDVITGTIATPCTGTTDCTKTVMADKYGVLNGFNAGAGYDLATGLGSVNTLNLVNNWATGQAAFRATTTTLSLAPTTGIVAGQLPDVTVNITVAPTSGPGTPTGDVALVSAAATGEGVTGFTLTAGAVINGTTNQLTGGTYNVTAHYAGDGTFAPSDSTGVSVTVGKANSSAVANVFSSTGGGIFKAFTSGPGPVTLYLSAVISPNPNPNPNTALVPTGTVTFVDGSTPVASNVKVDAFGEAFTAAGISSFATGAHSIVAQYSGDNSYTAINSTAAAFTINASTMTPTTTTVTPSVTSVVSGGSVMLTAKVTTASTGAGPTGTVQFKNGTSTLGAAATCTPTAGVGTTTAFCTATLTTTLSFLGPPAVPRQIPSLPIVPMWITAWALLLAFLLSLKRLPMAKRRGYVYAGLLLFACVAAGIAGCSGMKSTTGVAPHTDSITAVYSGDTTFATSTSTAVAISIH